MNPKRPRKPVIRRRRSPNPAIYSSPPPQPVEQSPPASPPWPPHSQSLDDAANQVVQEIAARQRSFTAPFNATLPGPMPSGRLSPQGAGYAGEGYVKPGYVKPGYVKPGYVAPPPSAIGLVADFEGSPPMDLETLRNGSEFHKVIPRLWRDL
jgi:hypothetical protein